MVSSLNTASAGNGYTYSPEDEPDTTLKLKITDMPYSLRQRAFEGYTEIFTKLRTCGAMNSHEDERAKVLKKMRSQKIHIAGDKGQFASTCENYDQIVSIADFAGLQNPFKDESIWKLTLASSTDSLCFALTSKMSSDLGGTAPNDWADTIDLFGTRSGRNKITLTPMSFAESDGLVSWYLLEYLLERYTDLDDTSRKLISRDCIRNKKK